MIKTIMYLTKVLIATAVAIIFASCKMSYNDYETKTKGNGNVSTQNRTITSDFQKIEVSNGIEAVISQSENQSISIETDENLQEIILTKIEGGVLKISAASGYSSSKSPKATVHLPVISGLTTSSGANLKCDNTLIVKDIIIKSSSGSEMTIQIEANDMRVGASSGSSATISGKAQKLSTDTSSGSDLNCKKLMANQVVSEASSGSTTKVTPIESLDAKASSGASIDYFKKPKTIFIKESSGGSISAQ